MLGEVLGGHDRWRRLEGEVLDHVDLELENDADEAIATHRQPEQSWFCVREQLTIVPSASISRSERTVEPNGPYGTGQPCALTLNVEATPKSLLDCMTAGEKRI